jgi:hypothetical protein
MMVPATLFFLLSAFLIRVHLWPTLIPQQADKPSKHLEEENNRLA